MSRIGRLPIEIPNGVTVEITGNKVVVKGSKGELSQEIRPEISVEVKDGKVVSEVKIPSKRTSAFWGLTRALIANMIHGVTTGYEKKLEIIGVGYRAKQNGSDGLTMNIGYSHPVDFKAPKGVEIQVVDQTHITVKGADKQLVGLAAALIRKIRKPEPYKGKGIKYEGEVIRRKAGKAGKVGAA